MSSSTEMRPMPVSQIGLSPQALPKSNDIGDFCDKLIAVSLICAGLFFALMGGVEYLGNPSDTSPVMFYVGCGLIGGGILGYLVETCLSKLERGT